MAKDHGIPRPLDHLAGIYGSIEDVFDSRF